MTTDDRLDEIIRRLRHMDNRDRLRTWGSFLKSFIWLAIIVGSTYYLIAYGDELMKQLVEQSASAAAKYTQQEGQGMLDQLMRQYQR